MFPRLFTASMSAFQGATSLSGDGCWVARYGCPIHGGPEDGHAITTGRVYRDVGAENRGGADDEEICLSSAAGPWLFFTTVSYTNSPCH